MKFFTILTIFVVGVSIIGSSLSQTYAKSIKEQDTIKLAEATTAGFIKSKGKAQARLRKS